MSHKKSISVDPRSLIGVKRSTLSKMATAIIVNARSEEERARIRAAKRKLRRKKTKIGRKKPPQSRPAGS